MFRDLREDGLYQGDIFRGVPFTAHLPGRRTIGSTGDPAMLLSHECDLAKPTTEFALLAVLRSARDVLLQCPRLASLDDEAREALRGHLIRFFNRGSRT